MVTRRAPAVLVSIAELNEELADRADDGVIPPQLHVELVIGIKLPAAALTVHHVHHWYMPQLATQQSTKA